MIVKNKIEQEQNINGKHLQNMPIIGIGLKRPVILHYVTLSYIRNSSYVKSKYLKFLSNERNGFL